MLKYKIRNPVFSLIGDFKLKAAYFLNDIKF